jgi:hypothetical protein
MTGRDWFSGSLVVAVAAIGFLVSSTIVNKHFARAPEAIPAPGEDPSRSDAGGTDGICITLGGATVRWAFPNAPFGVLRCEKTPAGTAHHE